MKVTCIKAVNQKDPELSLTFIEVDDGRNDKTLITVEGFGHGVYRWKVENNGGRLEAYDPAALMESAFGEREPDGFWIGANTLGASLVWASSLTFAHLVMDCIDNQ